MDRNKKNIKAGSRGIFLVCCFTLASTRAFAAGVEVDGATNTTLDTAPNGVPIVNIANPNSRGLSHNSYRQFNVNKPGLILNNSNQSVVKTQLGGQILGNAQLRAPARVILNEVTTTNRSVLNGFTEVAGQRADVVVANPNGISINGAGFINSSRVTLTTGVPKIDSLGNLGGFDVRSGEITVSGDGLNTQLQDSTSIYTHFLNLNAKIHAQKLDVVLGKNQIDYPGRKIVSSSNGDIKRVLLDSSALGGMYANKIVLVGTEQGLGMNLPPEVIASSGDISISNDGRIVLQQLNAGGNIVLRTGETIKSTATVYAAGSVDIDAQDRVVINSGMIAANSTVSIDTTRFDNHGSVIAGLADDRTWEAWGDIDIQALEVLNTSEIMSTNRLSVAADVITNQGLFNASKNLYLETTDLVNEATLFSGGDTQLLVRDNLRNAVNATIFTINDLLFAADDAYNRTTQITNELGLIQSLQGDIDIYAVNFDNLGTADLQYRRVYYDLGNGREVSHPSAAMNIDLAYSTGYTKHRSKARSRWVNKVLARLAAQAPLLYQSNANDIRANRSARFTAIETRLIDSSTTTPAYLDSGNDLNLHVDVFNNHDAVAAAARDINFDVARDYLNTATSASENVTDYQYYTRAKHSRNWKSDDKYSSKGRSGYLPVARTKTVSSNTVTQAGRNVEGVIGGQTVNSGVLSGQYQSLVRVDSENFSKSSITLPTNEFGLFVKSTAPTSQYLIETNPRFTRFDNFVSSDYLLDRLDFSASETLKRLGDAFYESKLIRDSIFALSGRRYLDSTIQNDNQQFQYLMDNALIARRTLELAPGVALNKDQINRLTRDIVWLEPRQVAGQTVLVPTVYLANGPKTEVRGGKIIAGGDTRLQLASLRNSGLIEGNGNVEIDAADRIENRGALIAGNHLGLSANRDIENISGTIKGADVAITSRKGSILNRRSREEYSYSERELSFSTTLHGAAGVIEADNVLSLDAAEQLVVEGSELTANHANLKASSVDIKTTSKVEKFYSGDKNNFVKEAVTTHFASAVNGQDIVILSLGSTTVSGSKLNATQDLRVVAGEIDISAVNANEFYASRASIKDSFSETVSTRKSFRSKNIASELNGATVVLITEHGDIELTGSEIAAGTYLAVNSAGDIRVEAGHIDSLDESYKHKSGWFSGGSIYSESEDLEGRDSRTAVRSKIKAGTFELEAAGGIELTGVDIAVTGNLIASAQDIALRNASNEETNYSKHTKISVGFDDLASNLTDIDDLVTQDDGKLTLKLADAKYEHAKSVSTQITAVASQIQAGTIQFNAGGEEAGDVLIEGSDLLAEDSIKINASGDVALLDAHHVSTSETKTQSGTAELSLTLQNEYQQVSRSINAVKQAERDLRHTKDDYDQYQQDLEDQEAAFQQLQQDFAAGVGFVEQADIDDFNRYLERMRDDEEFYKANIALAVVTLSTQTTQLVKQTARAAESSGTYGFNAGLELDIDALEQRVDEYYRQSRASNLSADRIAINAGDVALLRGSALQATDSIDITADDIKMLAGVSASTGSERNRHINFAYNWDLLGANSSRDLDQLGGSASGDSSRRDGDSTQYNNTQLLAANIRLSTNGDTTIEGADIHASDHLEIDTENLKLASVQNVSFNKTRSQGLSYSREGGGINDAEGDGESVQTLITRLSGQQVDILVGNHTEIKGAVIAAVDSEGQDNGQLNLSTNTLNAGSLNSTVDNTNRSIGVEGGEVASLDYQKDGEFAKVKSLATLGSGDIRITDTEGSNTRLLNTDIENTQVAIYNLESHQGLSGELDTRLLTEDGRKQIAEDWVKTEMIGNTIGLITTTDRVDMTDFFDETEKYYRTYEAVKDQVRASPELAAMLQDPNLTPDQKQLMLNQVVGAVMVELEFNTHENLIIATDQKTPGGELFYGFYSAQNGNAYINDSANESTRDLIATAGHEATHAMDDQAGMEISNLDPEERSDINVYANNYGENLANYTDFALDFQGYDGLALSNEHVGNDTGLVLANTTEFTALDHGQGDFYCANSFSCYGAETEMLFKQAQTKATPIAVLENYQIREKVSQEGHVVGYEAFNPDTQNTIVMLPEELSGFTQVVEAVSFVGFSLENMTIAEHAANNATFGLHNEGYQRGLVDSWDFYLSDPNNYLEIVIGAASSVATTRIFRINSKSVTDLEFRPDFYTKTDGTSIQSTGYRYVDSNAKYLDDLRKTGVIPESERGTYFSFEKFDDAREAADKLQVPHNASIRIEFDTKQIVDEIEIPKGKWGTADYYEPITKDFPGFGKGNTTQAITRSPIRADKIEDLMSGEILYEQNK